MQGTHTALIHGNTWSAFILGVSHSICDSVSLSSMLRDVLAAMVDQRLAPLVYLRWTEELLDIAPVAPPRRPIALSNWRDSST